MVSHGIQYLTLTIDPRRSLSACPHRQFHALPGLLDSRATLPNSNPNALRAMQGGSLFHFYDGLLYDPAGTRTHDLLCERPRIWRCYYFDDIDVHTLLAYENVCWYKLTNPDTLQEAIIYNSEIREKKW